MKEQSMSRSCPACSARLDQQATARTAVPTLTPTAPTRRPGPLQSRSQPAPPPWPPSINLRRADRALRLGHRAAGQLADPGATGTRSSTRPAARPWTSASRSPSTARCWWSPPCCWSASRCWWSGCRLGGAGLAGGGQGEWGPALLGTRWPCGWSA